MSDFSEHPISLPEARARRSGQASDWTPRDALIDTLRRLDSGELNIDAAIVVYREVGPDDTSAVAATIAVGDRHTALGIMLEGILSIDGE